MNEGDAKAVQAMQKPDGALVSELAAAWGVGDRGAVDRIRRGMLDGWIFAADHAFTQGRHYFNTAAVRDSWLKNGALVPNAPIEQLALKMLRDGRPYLTPVDLSEAFNNCRSSRSGNALQRLMDRGLAFRVNSGNRAFFFASEVAARTYPASKLESSAYQLNCKRAACRSDVSTARAKNNISVAAPEGKKAPPKRGLIGDVTGMDTAPRVVVKAPPGRFDPEPGYRGPFATGGKYMPGIDPMTGQAWA